MGISFNRVLYNPAKGRGLTVIAHRGASAYFPENTLVSFEGAMKGGADMIELDVQLTRDGEVVVFHDETIDRCTDGRGTIGGHTLAELKKLDAGSWFHPRFAGTRIPTLAEVLDLCRDRIAVNIEIKTEAVTDLVAGGIEEKTLDLVVGYGMRGHVYYSSFDPRAIGHLKTLDRGVPVAVLYERGHYGSRLPSAIVEMLGADAFNCSRRDLGRRWRVDLARHTIPVYIYTVNDRKRMARFIDRGVSGLITNNPDVLREVVDRDRGGKV